MPPKKKAKTSSKPAQTKIVVPELPLEDGALRSMNLVTANKVGSVLVSVSTGNDTQTAKYVKTRDEYALKVELKSSERFSLKPMVITSGILKGRQVLVLEPDQTPTTGLSFLSLPPEVRNLIYSALLLRSDGSPCAVRGNQLRYVRCVGLDGLSPFGLFRTNHQIYQEAATVYYGMNHFNFTDTTTLFHYLTRIGSSAKYLRHVEVDGISKSTVDRAAKLLAVAENLQVLRLSPAGHTSFMNFLSGGNNDIDAHYVIAAFRPVFDALQKTRNDRRKVWSIMRIHNAESKCMHHRMYPDDKLHPHCACISTEQFEKRLKGYFKEYVKDKDADGNPVLEPKKVRKTMASTPAVEAVKAEDDVSQHSSE